MLQNTGVLNEILKEDNYISIAKGIASSSDFFFLRKVIIFPSEFIDKAG